MTKNSLALTCLLFGIIMCFGNSAARAEGLLHLDHCRIADDHGPIKAMGVNYVNGFWNFAHDGTREKYLPYLDAIAEAKIPFIRMGFGPWAKYAPNTPNAPGMAQIAEFVTHRDQYFDRLKTFLADAHERHIGVVLDVFWDTDPYTVYFQEPAQATAVPNSKTSIFLKDTVTQLAQRFGNDPAIWMIEFENEGGLGIDFPNAPHTRAEFVARTKILASALVAGGDRHLVDSGDSMPRPAAEHLAQHQGWQHDNREEFLHALDTNTTDQVSVASVHIYPEKVTDRPWDGGDIMGALPVLGAYSMQTCHPVFVGEFGARDDETEMRYIRQIAGSTVQIAAVWGLGRDGPYPLSFKLDAQGRELLHRIGDSNRR